MVEMEQIVFSFDSNDQRVLGRKFHKQSKGTKNYLSLDLPLALKDRYWGGGAERHATQSSTTALILPF